MHDAVNRNTLETLITFVVLKWFIELILILRKCYNTNNRYDTEKFYFKTQNIGLETKPSFPKHTLTVTFFLIIMSVTTS